jgi:hypothetical protein
VKPEPVESFVGFQPKSRMTPFFVATSPNSPISGRDNLTEM